MFLLAVGVAPVFFFASPSLGGSGPPNPGSPPLDCGVAHKDYTDSTCTTQTRNGTFHFDRHLVHAGGTLTGTVSARCMKHPNGDFSKPPDQNCPIDWAQMLGAGKRVSGCSSTASSCTVKISKKAQSTKYTIVTVGITSDQGTGISKDYYAIVGGDYYVLNGHVTDENSKPVAGVWVSVSGKKDVSKRTDAGGGYEALLPKGRYNVNVDGRKPIASSGCAVAGKRCEVNLDRDRTADFGGTPQFTIDVAARYDGLDHNGDHIVDYFPPTDHAADPALDPNHWVVTFALKGYPTSCQTGATYSWSIKAAKGGRVYPGDGCRFVAKLDTQGKFTATLKVSHEGGAAVSADDDFEIKDTLIVSFGDSFGSGEGAPESTGTGYAWESARCHTSSQSGFALAARSAALAAKADDNESKHIYHRVTFLHLACSGALAGPGLTQSYEGIEPGGATSELAPQLTQMEQLLPKRLDEIGAIMISAGGNDIGFSPIIHACASIPPFDFSDCDSLAGFPQGNARFHSRLATLVFQYGQIHKRLAALSKTAGIDLNARVLITTYPDFTHDQNGVLCNGPGTFGQIEWGWALSLLGQLNDAISTAAKSYHWHVVSAHTQAFRTHGYCSTDSWMDRLVDWGLNPGGVGSSGLAPTGVFHPNVNGQEAYAAAITPVLEALLK